MQFFHRAHFPGLKNSPLCASSIYRKLPVALPPDFTIHNPNNSIHEIVYPMMKNSRNVVPGGPDVQWADYERINPKTGRYYTAVELLDAIDLVDPWYMFWEKREPYFSRDVIPAIREFHKNGGNLGHK